jgi:gluconate 2-dehydrogenase gamma chain
MDDIQNRRAFLRAAAAAGAAWAAADLVQVEDALAWADHQTATGGAAGFGALTKNQADAIDALASRILPSVDGRPGAREAGAVYFIDRALATFNAAQRPLYTEGIAELDRRARGTVPGIAGFAALTAAQQDEVIRDIEATPFFQTIRVDTIVGALALPSWGGNREYMGWHMLGFEHQPAFQAPFGYYDADASRTN